MKKRLLFSAQVVLFALFNFALFATILQFFGDSNPLTRFEYKKSVYNNIEAFDPSLAKLNTLKKIEHYCDSLYAESLFSNPTVEFERTYVDVVSNTIRNRFYHGYSYEDFNSNYVGLVLSKVTVPGWAALVDPDDILKFPYAACSQQAIVMMEILKAKGFKSRKVTFLGKTAGHFAFEVFYDNAWHFNDPNMEPEKAVLDKYGRPSIEFLVRNPQVLLAAYNRYPKEKIMDIFPSYSYGTVNKFPAPRAELFQKITHFLSYTSWLFLLVAFLFVRHAYLRVTGKRASWRRIAVPQMQPETSPVLSRA